jgi:hypothetical protein
MPSSVVRSIRISGQSVIVAMRATTGRFSLSTTARARMLFTVSVDTCMMLSRYGHVSVGMQETPSDVKSLIGILLRDFL